MGIYFTRFITAVIQPDTDADADADYLTEVMVSGYPTVSLLFISLVFMVYSSVESQ